MLSSLDFLYIVLSIGIALLSIFLSIVLVYAIFILRDMNKATDAIRDSAERIHSAVIKPLKMTHELLKYARPVVEIVEKRMAAHQDAVEKKEEKKKKEKK
ncbi:MAG: hypothetical protein WC882_01730 [Candidatus Gracilibacteria bacterium]